MVGKEVYSKQLKWWNEMYREKAIDVMRDYFNEKRFIDHTLKVLSTADDISKGEGIDAGFLKEVVMLSAIFHDIGIPESLKKYSSLEAQYQEQEGPPVARELLSGIGVRPDIRERVCYIVGNHHTEDSIDGIDFRIIWEADFIVNIEEKNIIVEPKNFMKEFEKNIKTAAGKKYAVERLKDFF